VKTEQLHNETALNPAMPLSPGRVALGIFVLAAALSTSVIAQATNEQVGPAAQEPRDLSFEDAVNHGVAAFKNARYEAAVQHFKTAVALDPTSAKAHLYLGTAYGFEVVPNLDTPDNLATANNAIAALRQVPEGDPGYLSALKQIASLYRNTKRLDEAKETELEVLKLNPTDAESHYAVGVIDWMQAYKSAVQILARADLKDDGIGNQKLDLSACLELSAQNSNLVQDGIEHLTRAIELKPDYEDAMQYLNLTYRCRADFACGDDRKRADDLAQADQWSRKALEVRRQRELLQSAPK
jgi:tetratricopeptide (TPR) repeat protein